MSLAVISLFNITSSLSEIVSFNEVKSSPETVCVSVITVELFEPSAADRPDIPIKNININPINRTFRLFIFSPPFMRI